MNLLFQILLGTKQLKLEDWHIDSTTSLRLIVTAASIQDTSCCPLCHQPARRIHSRYQRTVADVPWALWGVTVQLKVRKFFCDRPGCERRIFTERLAEFVTPWARRTNRLADRLTAIGLALGGAAGARLTVRLGIRVCRNTLLALVRRAPHDPGLTRLSSGSMILPFANATPTVPY